MVLMAKACPVCDVQIATTRATLKPLEVLPELLIGRCRVRTSVWRGKGSRSVTFAVPSPTRNGTAIEKLRI